MTFLGLRPDAWGARKGPRPKKWSKGKCQNAKTIPALPRGVKLRLETRTARMGGCIPALSVGTEVGTSAECEARQKRSHAEPCLWPATNAVYGPRGRRTQSASANVRLRCCCWWSNEGIRRWTLVVWMLARAAHLREPFLGGCSWYSKCSAPR